MDAVLTRGRMAVYALIGAVGVSGLIAAIDVADAAARMR